MRTLSASSAQHLAPGLPIDEVVESLVPRLRPGSGRQFPVARGNVPLPLPPRFARLHKRIVSGLVVRGIPPRRVNRGGRAHLLLHPGSHVKPPVHQSFHFVGVTTIAEVFTPVKGLHWSSRRARGATHGR